MPRNKVIYGDEVLIDLTADTVTADTLAEGVTAHDAAGNAITGTMAAGGGAKIATGTVTAADKTVTVTGLDFTPTHVTLLRTEIHNLGAIEYSHEGVSHYKSASTWRTGTVTRTELDGGFSLQGGTGSANTFNGTYNWIAWTD